MNIKELLETASNAQASDIFLVAGLPLSYRLHGSIKRVNDMKLLPDDTLDLVKQIYELANHRDIQQLFDTGDDDFSFALKGVSRFRVNTFRQRGSIAAVIRVITFSLPEPHELGIPDQVIDFGSLNKGLVLVTGPAGSGKSTTLACMVDKINNTMERHIITLEDPLEFLHPHKKICC